MCKNITTKFPKCGHEEVNDFPCNEILDGAACSGKTEQVDTDSEKKCPDCEHYDNALLQIATDANLAPHKPTAGSAPAYTGPKMYHIRRFVWKHCKHIKDFWTDEECFDPECVYLMEPQEWACDKCAAAHPSILDRMREERKLDKPDAWGLSIKDATKHPKFGVKSSTPATEPSLTPATSTHTRPPPITVTQSPPHEDRSLYELTPPAGATSYYAEDEPAATHEPSAPHTPAPDRATQPSRGDPGRPPAPLNPIHEDEPAAGRVDDDLDDTDGEGDDDMRARVLAMSSKPPPAFCSKMPHGGGLAHEHEAEDDYPVEPEEPLHEAPPDWSAAPVDEEGDLTPEERREAKRYRFPAGVEVTRTLLERRRDSERLARRRLLMPEEQVMGPGQRRK